MVTNSNRWFTAIAEISLIDGSSSRAPLPPDRCHYVPIYRRDINRGTELAMNGTSAKKGANSQRFYGCAYNENGTNVRRADGEIDEMHEKDVVTKRETHIPEGRR